MAEFRYEIEGFDPILSDTPLSDAEVAQLINEGAKIVPGNRSGYEIGQALAAGIRQDNATARNLGRAVGDHIATSEFRYVQPNQIDLASPGVRAVEKKYGIPEGLLSSLAWVESKGRVDAKNPRSTATGLFQFIKATANEYGIDPRDPQQSLDAAARMLVRNYKRTGSWSRAVGAHYGGPGAPFDQPVGPDGLSPAAYANKVGKVLESQAYTRVGRRKEAGWSPTVVRVGSGLAAGVASNVPVVGTVAGMSISAAGEILAQEIEKSQGAREATNWGVVGLEAGVGAIPMGGIATRAGVSAAREVGETAAVRAIQGAVVGAGSDQARSVLETGQTMSIEDSLKSAVTGAVVGGTFGGVEGKLRTRATLGGVGGRLGNATADAAAGVSDLQAEAARLRARLEKYVSSGVGDSPDAGHLRARLAEIDAILQGNDLRPPEGPQGELFEPRAGDPSDPRRGPRPVGQQATPDAITNIYQQTLKTGVSRQIRDDFRAHGKETVKELLKTEASQEGRRLYLQMAEAALGDNDISDGLLKVLARSQGSLTLKDVFEFNRRNGGGFLTTASDAGRHLAYLSHVQRRFQKLIDSDPELMKLAMEAGWKMKYIPWWSKALDRAQTTETFRRVMMVGQFVTAFRNAGTNIGAVGWDVATTGAKHTLPKFLGGTGKGARHGAREMAHYVNEAWHSLQRGNTKEIDDLFVQAMGGGPADEMAARQFKRERLRNDLGKVEDLTAIGDRTKFGDTGVRPSLARIEAGVTWLGRTSEDFFRRTVFQQKFNERLRDLGKKSVDDLTPEEMDDALGYGVHAALRETFALDPTSERGKRIMDAYQTLSPITGLVQPFPRYWVNAMKFALDYNPLGWTRLVSKKSRDAQKAIHGPDRVAEIAARGMIGSGLLMGGVALRAGSNAGDKWYEVKGDDGTTYDLRGTAGPFLPYLFLGHVAVNGVKNLTAEDWMQGMTAVQRTPTVITGLSDAARGDAMTFRKGIERIAGEWVGGFTVPLRTIKDVLAADNASSEGVFYDTSEPLDIGGILETHVLNPTIQNVPLLGQALDRPAARSITTGAPRRAEHPAWRQATGVMKERRTPLETELKRLGLAENLLLPKTGISKANRALTERTGKLAHHFSDNLLARPDYKKENDAGKRAMIRKFYSHIRKIALTHLERTDPALRAALKLKSGKLRSSDVRQSSAISNMFDEAFGLPVDETVDRLVEMSAPE